ncbi:MAG: DODA-type extradiol aromatic ring-opening family dioxygenase [Maricaulaceae bacterium]
MGESLTGLRAILVLSAHWRTDRPQFTAAAAPNTLHDFRGFGAERHAMTGPAPGAPELAAQAAALTDGTLDPHRGLDHGVWVPLSLLRPNADIPVVQAALPTAGLRAAYTLGRHLRPLRAEGVAIIGSGGVVHNLNDLNRSQDAVETPWARAFADWVDGRLHTQDLGAVFNFRQIAPYGARAHPTEEHFAPLLAALGGGRTPGEAASERHIWIDDHGWVGVRLNPPPGYAKPPRLRAPRS